MTDDQEPLEKSSPGAHFSRSVREITQKLIIGDVECRLPNDVGAGIGDHHCVPGSVAVDDGRKLLQNQPQS